MSHSDRCTVKILNFVTPEIFAVIYLKFKQRGKTLEYFFQNGANGTANSEDPDETALFAQTYLSEILGLLQYLYYSFMQHKYRNSRID